MKFQHVENEEYMTQSNRVDRVYILIKLRRDHSRMFSFILQKICLEAVGGVVDRQ